MRHNINTIFYLKAALAGALVLLAACHREVPENSEDPLLAAFDDDAIVFGQFVSGTKVWIRDDDLIDDYSASDIDREFQVEMYKKVDDTPTKVGSTLIYKVSSDYPADGVLVAKDTPFYWPDNVTAYAFRAASGNDAVQADQSTKEKFYNSDYIVGYGYEALKENSTAVDNIDTLNYHTSKVWYAMNAVSYGTGVTAAKQKTVPLFLKHKKSRISIILKAGQGVDRSKLAFVNAGSTLKDTIYSYSGSGRTGIIPYATEEFVHYDAEGDLPAQDSVSTTRFDAIVEPYDYMTNSENVISRINLSGLKFSFYAINDSRFISNYHLGAGQQLVITVKLENTGHIIVMSAQIQNWSEEVTYGVADDFGHGGDPVLISCADSLKAYMKDSQKNRAGQVAIVTASEIDLTSCSWPSSDTVKGTLNLAGARIVLNSRFVTAIGAKGNLLNGDFVMKNGTNVASAICETNSGTINSITVSHSADSTAKATVAGMVEMNYGKIYNSRSSLPVLGTSDYIGGIAGKSASQGGSSPVIEGCEVLCSVKGSGSCIGGGIVGMAEGTVTANTNSYGITLSQNSTNFKNIIGVKGSGTLTAANNGWPTKDADSNAGTNTWSGTVDGVIDCREDLMSSLNTANNVSGKTYTIQNDFTVDKEYWGERGEEVKYTLSGSDHTVVLTGSGDSAARLFKKISGSISDVIVDVQKPITVTSDDNASSAAAFAEEVIGTAVLDNIRVKTTNGAYIESANPAGIVVYAKDNATVSSCQFQGSIKVHLGADLPEDGKCFCGGIVSMVYGNATVTKSVCHTASPFSRTDSHTDEYKNIYYGGIVGGVLPTGDISPTYPKLLLTDCTSNYLSSESEQCGGIIGYAKYVKDETDVSGLASGCQGNWWTSGMNAIATKGCVENILETKLIGKCNAIKPTLDNNW